MPDANYLRILPPPDSPEARNKLSPWWGRPVVDAATGWMARQHAQSQAAGLEDPSTGLPTSLGIRSALAQIPNALVMGTSAPGIRAPGIRAFHGSPYDFNAFDSSKIGTGEGAQAFGYGHYAAGAEDTARYYRDTLSKWPDNVAQHVNDITGVDVSEDYLPAIRQIAMGSGAGAGSATTALKARVPELRDVDGSSMIGPHPTLENLITAIRADQNKGHMYELNINADPGHFLDWDKPLSEQHDKVVSAIADLAAKKGIPMGNATGARAYEDLSNPPYGTRGHGVSDPAALSEALRDAGIPGIRYLDQGSRAQGEGTSNFVIFDPKNIEILRKYGIAGLIGAGAASSPYASGAPAQQSEGDR